jgi:hypothetical protein
MGKVRGFGNEREGRKTQERTSGLKLRMPKRSVTKPADKPLNPLMKTEGGGGGGVGEQRAASPREKNELRAEMSASGARRGRRGGEEIGPSSYQPLTGRIR